MSEDFPGGGETGALIRSLDWSRTPLGPRDAWPVSLKTLVRTMLHARQPMILWWGPELTQIYNDAMLESMRDKHPLGMGQPGREAWKQAWLAVGHELQAVLDDGTPIWNENIFVPVDRNGRIEDAWWTYSYSPAFDDAGERAGMVIICTETTAGFVARREAERLAVERAALYEREKLLRAAAEEASRLKDEFLATVSHELRTPLTAMLGWVQLLRANQLPEERHAHALETIERNARAQGQIIEDLLDVARIASGKLTLEDETVALAPVVESAVESVRPTAAARGVELRVALDPATSVRGDAARLLQVASNLLSNAVKFTSRGGEVRVSLGQTGDAVELAVADDGQGIEPAFLPYVFEQFRQGDGATTRSHGGLGLGLSIVKSLVERHGGTVTARSEGLGRGATFEVRLPLAAAWRGAAPAPSQSLPEFRCPDGLVGLKVLVVEDEDDTRDLLQTVLRRCGAVVEAAPSVALGLERFATFRPHLVLSDIGMPGEDGYALIERIRALSAQEGGHTPAVALTAFSRPEDRARALRAGFQAHVAKPVQPAELVEALAALAPPRG